MRTADQFLATLDRSPAPMPAIMPWDYVRMRRQAAGLSIEQAAMRYAQHPGQHEAVAHTLRLLEKPGCRLAPQFHIADMARAFPISFDVYSQLAGFGTAGAQPKLCIICGWDVWTPQADMNGDECRWSDDDPDTCTLCSQAGRARLLD